MSVVQNRNQKSYIQKEFLSICTRSPMYQSLNFLVFRVTCYSDEVIQETNTTQAVTAVILH